MPHSSRLASIDCFRGFAVLAMLLANCLLGTKALPGWLRPAPNGGLTLSNRETSCCIFAGNIQLLILFGGAP
jgi:predicted acyltransferase